MTASLMCLDGGTAVVGPALGVGGSEVDDGRTLAVGAHGLGPHAGGLVEPASVVADAEGVEFAVELSGHRCAPCAAIGAAHLQGVLGGAAAAGGVEQHLRCLGFGRPQREVGARGVDAQFQVVASVGREVGVACVGIGGQGCRGCQGPDAGRDEMFVHVCSSA